MIQNQIFGNGGPPPPMFSLCRKMSVLSEYICLPFTDILPKVLPSGFMAILGPRNLIMRTEQNKTKQN